MKARILIVEDEPAISDNIQFILETEGLETVRVGTGLAALPILEEGPVDVIVLDIGLPDINGFELLKEIRRAPAFCQISRAKRGASRSSSITCSA